ncbi:hypothetical protein G9A89_010360 [Geosiphon pyriformis]|nr:hypothetical protein G9A89_010360 [Geosiphon pyriformis]
MEITQQQQIQSEYYKLIYTHCKQRFNIPDRIEVVKKSVYYYIENHINNYLFGNYNISEVRSNLYNNLVHYSQLRTEDLNSETLDTYFQELNFNIIEYCEEKYPIQPKYFFNFKSETETSNKGKQKLKQYSRTIPNTPTLQKTTAKHLQTPEQGTSVKLPLSITPFPISLLPRNPTQQQKPISTSANIIDYLQENESNHSESLESKETESEPEEITENKKEMTTAYIAKIPEFTSKDNDTSLQEWLDKIQKAGDTNAFKDAFLQQFTNNNTSITLRNHFHNIKQETSESFIAKLKDKLIKKVHSHALADLATAIRHAKSYEMAMEKANHTKLTNSQRKLKAILQTNNNSSNNHKDINPHNDTTKTILDYHPTTNLKIVIIVEFQDTKNEIVGNCKKTNKTGVINQPLPIQPYQIPPTQQYQVPAKRLLVPRNLGQQRPNHYHTQPSYLTIPEKSDFQQTAFLKMKLQHIFPFEFEANESPFLLSNAAVNKQKAITAMYTETTVEGKLILLILNSGSAGSIITYQLMQQLKRNVDRPAQTIIVTADGMKKTPVGKINDFSFSIDGITIPVKVLVMDAPQYQALVRNNWLLKANANLNWETQELKSHTKDNIP